MKAIQLARFGNPEVLEIVELPVPYPGPGEVQVRIRAAGVNFFETLVRQNRYAVTPQLPTILGVEAAGVVEALGEEVDTSLLHRRVGLPMFAGGVGSLLIQLAKRAGAKSIIALAGTPEKLRLATSLGADFALDYQEPSWLDQLKESTNGTGIDIIYDSVGGPLTGSLLTALAPLGQLIFAALSRCQLTARDLENMFHKNQSIKGFALLPLLNPATLKEELSSLFNLAQSGDLKVLIGGRYQLENAAEAHRALENRLTTGKVVLIP